MGDASTNNCDSSLAWLWIIEYLASFQEIDPSTLHDVIEAAPELPDELGKNTREMVSLRCLEDLFGSSNDGNGDIIERSHSVVDSKVEFDLSESCEEVLQSILHETSVSELRTGGPELLKWHVHPFILHKRASMPKCALEQLKDAILEGTHPFATSLKEHGGLVHRDNKYDQITEDGSNCNSVTRKINESATNVLILAPEGNSSPPLLENERRVVGDDLHDGKVVQRKRDRSDLANENLAGDYRDNEGCMDDGDDLNLCAKRLKRDVSQTIQQMDHVLIPPCDKEFVGDSIEKIIGDSGNAGCHVETESQLGGLDENRPPENDKNEGVFDADHGFQNRCESALITDKMQEDASGDPPSQYISMDEADDVEARTSNGACCLRTEQDVSVDEARNNSNLDTELNPVPNANKMQEDASGYPSFQYSLVDEADDVEDGTSDGAYCIRTEQQVSVDEAKDSTDLCTQLNAALHANKMQEDASGDPPPNHVLVDEVDNVEARTSNSPQCVRTEQQVSVDQAKDNTNLGDQFNLANDASSNGFHRDVSVGGADGKECLSEEETSNDTDERAHERFDVDMKKSHFLSSQCALTDDPLSTYDWTEQNLCVKCNKGGQLLVCNFAGCPLVVHENCLGMSARFDELGNFYCPFCAYSLAISAYLEAKKKASLARKELSTFIQKGLEPHPKERTEKFHNKEHTNLKPSRDEDLHQINENENSSERDHNQINNRSHVCKVNDHQLQKTDGDNQQVGPLAPNIDASLRVRDGDPVATNMEKEREEIAQESLSARGLHGQQDQIPSDPKATNDSLLSKKKKTIGVSKGQSRGGLKREVLEKHIIDPSKKPDYHGHHIGREDTTDDENCKSVLSNYSTRIRKREMQYTYPAIPQLRRKKVPWTVKEEETLKEGVQKFSSVYDKSIPWKKILEYGGSIFESSRTAVDLKDKWRNMCRGSPKVK